MGIQFSDHAGKPKPPIRADHSVSCKVIRNLNDYLTSALISPYSDLYITHFWAFRNEP